MTTIGGARSSRFAFITEAHHFLLEVLPVREPESSTALAVFVAKASAYPVSPALVDAVLLRCLTILNRHLGDPLPSLVDSYISRARTVANQWDRFSKCVAEALKYRGVRDISVQQAIAIIEERYHDSCLAPREVAALVGRRPAVLTVAFKRHTGMTASEYLRRTRLAHAARLLTMTTKSIKEVWSQVGYNHGSNFDHDFKRHFGASPRDYRARAIHPWSGHLFPHSAIASALPAKTMSNGCAPRQAAVLIVDHNASVQSTLIRSLRLEGFSISMAATGAEALGLIDRTAPDVMLLEYHLPDMSGMDCLRALRRIDARLPAVGIFTADWDVYDDTKEIHSLNGSVASKLCDLDEVKELIMRLLRDVQESESIADHESAGLPVGG